MRSRILNLIPLNWYFIFGFQLGHERDLVIVVVNGKDANDVLIPIGHNKVARTRKADIHCLIGSVIFTSENAIDLSVSYLTVSRARRWERFLSTNAGSPANRALSTQALHDWYRPRGSDHPGSMQERSRATRARREIDAYMQLN